MIRLAASAVVALGLGWGLAACQSQDWEETQAHYQRHSHDDHGHGDHGDHAHGDHADHAHGEAAGDGHGTHPHGDHHAGDAASGGEGVDAAAAPVPEAPAATPAS